MYHTIRMRAIETVGGLPTPKNGGFSLNRLLIQVGYFDYYYMFMILIIITIKAQWWTMTSFAFS